VEPVTTNDMLAIDTRDLLAETVRHPGLRGFHIVQLYILYAMNDGAAAAIPSLIKIPGELGLPIHDDRLAARQGLKIDAIAPSIVGDEEALVNLAFPVHAFADLRLAHQSGKPVLEHTCTHTSQHVLARMLLEHDRLDTLQVQQL
jgi:hypothetical protein